MTATNHVLTGALIGSVLPLPVAIPAAFISHFVLDRIPHFGTENEGRDKSVAYQLVVYLDIAFALAIGIVILLMHKWSMLAGSIAAYSPDSTLVFYYFRNGHSFNIKPKNGFMKFHLAIQYERPWGLFSELAVATLSAPLVVYALIR